MSAAAILKLQTVGFTMEQVAALADLVEAKPEPEQKISELQLGSQRFILATVALNAVMILGAMFGLAKPRGH